MQQPYIKPLIFAGHCIAIALFTLSPWFFEPPHHANDIETISSMTLVFMANNLLSVLFFYINGWFLVPRLLLLYRYKAYFFTLLATCCLLFAGMGLLNKMCGKPPPPAHHAEPDARHGPPQTRHLRPPIKSTAALLLLGVWGLSTTLAFVRKWRSLEQADIERTANQTTQELATLRAQINPHFLFNTLNNIYTLTQTNADAAGEAILQLADFMRYAVQEGDKNTIPLDKEVTYIQHYIALQRLRLSNLTTIDFQTSGDLSNAHIAPLLFMPFIENAFGYGVSTRLPSHIIIHIWVETKKDGAEKTTKIGLKVQNPILKTSQTKSSGVALINTKRRLALLYPDHHTLVLSESSNVYTVVLEID